jgi:hypothetical protein
MRSDSDMKHDVEAALRLDPDIGAADIAVAMTSGVVMLTGSVRSDSRQRQAEGDVRRVPGVVGVANDIEVLRPVDRPDPEIARDAAAIIKSELPNSFEDVKALVKDGVITLEGDVTSDHQRERLEWAMFRVRGAKRINSLLVLKPTPSPNRNQARDRAGLSTNRGDRRDPDHGGSRWRLRHPARHGSLVGRTRGSRACRLGRAWCDQGRQPTHLGP